MVNKDVYIGRQMADRSVSVSMTLSNRDHFFSRRIFKVRLYGLI